MQHLTLNTFRLPGGGRKPFYPEIEAALLEYVKETRNKKLCVTKASIQIRALNLTKNDPKYNGFKCFLNWVRNFLNLILILIFF